MKWFQGLLSLSPRSRGFHLITDEVLAETQEIHRLKHGLLHLFIQHTSASLTLNENASPDVRRDFEKAANQLCPETLPFEHTYEGADDMPAHVKSSLFGASLSLPIANGRLALGTWQGIYLCEHRNHGGSRRLVWTACGELES